MRKSQLVGTSVMITIVIFLYSCSSLVDVKESDGTVNPTDIIQVNESSIVKEIQMQDPIVVTENGFQLETRISDNELAKGEQLKVEATITNLTDKSVEIYDHAECGEPVAIGVLAESSSVHLTNPEREETACVSMHDISKFRSLGPNETLTREAFFIPEIRYNTNQYTDAHTGHYSIIISFGTLKKNEEVTTSIPITVINESPTILTVVEARDIAMVNTDIKEWFSKYTDKRYTVQEETYFLTDGKWYLIFWAYKDNKPIENLIVNVDIKTQEVQQRLGEF